VLALGLARWCRIDLLGALRPSWESVGWGVAATAPMYLGYRVLKRSRRSSLVELRDFVEGMVRGIFGGTTRIGLGLIAAAAGLGEEALFRGWMQPWLGGMWGVLAGVAATSVAFGLLHALTPVYGILAACIGLYLGWLSEATGGLVAPVIAHGLYDFLVLQDIARGGRGAAGGE
jgi:membrane protease YdiL (CAAX protease family)